eukprot:15399399-Heterocapsa_arctica.AAC.1
MSIASSQQGHERSWRPPDKLREVTQAPSLQNTLDGGRTQHLSHDEVRRRNRNIMTNLTGNAP